MPEGQQFFKRRNGLTVWVNGPAGSGKTRLAMGFPRVLAITFDPSGLDVLMEPENAKLKENLAYYVPMNGLDLNQVFQFTEQPGESGVYAAIALAKQLAKQNKIDTVLVDGFTYLSQLKWTQICQAKGVDPTSKEMMDKREADQRSWYDALGSYLDHLVLQNLLPLATRDDLNVVITCHVQRESDNNVKGIQMARNPTAMELQAASKRMVNLDSDLSPQVLGSFRQRIDGMPSATIYLEHRLVNVDNKEQLKYYAYCKLTRSQSLDTVVKAKNRFGLGTLDLTNGSFYKTLLKRIEDSRNVAQPSTEGKPLTTKQGA